MLLPRHGSETGCCAVLRCERAGLTRVTPALQAGNPCELADVQRQELTTPGYAGMVAHAWPA
jgi:hypothetical protein